MMLRLQQQRLRAGGPGCTDSSESLADRRTAVPTADLLHSEHGGLSCACKTKRDLVQNEESAATIRTRTHIMQTPDDVERVSL
jgi:hypothetical protein